MFQYTTHLLLGLTTKWDENWNLFENIENTRVTNHVIKLALPPSNHQQITVGLWKDILEECYWAWKDTDISKIVIICNTCTDSGWQMQGCQEVFQSS